MLSDFFSINLPYCIEKNKKGEWVALNREYLPLGYNDYDLKGKDFSNLPIHTKYSNLTEEAILRIVKNEKFVNRNDNGEIIYFFLYNDLSNPIVKSKTNDAWEAYFEKLRELALCYSVLN